MIWKSGYGFLGNAAIKTKWPNLYEPVTRSRMFAVVSFQRFDDPMSGFMNIQLKKKKNKLFKFIKKSTKLLMHTPLLLTVRVGRKNEHHLIELSSYKRRYANKQTIYIKDAMFEEIDNITFLQLVDQTRTRFEKKVK